tara:strand:+ start:2094 stop:2657 length:564 start_codon:yes stop_codon:yes gene_type:complete
MSFIGTVGVVAQQGNQTVASAPTGVSIATSASGNYNNAIASGEANCNNETMSLDGSEFSTNSADRDVEVVTWSNMYTGCDSSATIHYQGYIRATGATSYAWNIIGFTLNTSLSNGCSASVGGTASTTQDETSGNIGEYVSIAFGGGRGGLTFPADGDTVEVEIRATATNSAGSTNSSTLTITYNFQD